MTQPDATLAGRLLVATPLITGHPFHRSVVFVSEHDASGAVGVILNAPSMLTVAEVLPELAPMASEPAVVHIGGPVQSDSAVVLAQSRSVAFARDTALDGVGIIDPSEPPTDALALRVFAGFAGWDDGQLETELAESSWWPVDATASDVFTDSSDGLWERAVRRLKGSRALYATYPEDPLKN